MEVTATPRIITQVRLLIWLVSLFAVLSISLILWQANAHNTTLDIANNYHSAASRHIQNISKALDKISSDQRMLHGPHTHDDRDHEVVHLFLASELQYIRQNHESLQQINQRYQQSDFTRLNSHLDKRLQPVIDQLFSQGLHTQPRDFLLEVDAVLLTLQQLERLHGIAASKLLADENRLQRSRSIIVMVVLAIVILTTVLLTLRTLRSIRSILDDQKQAQDRLSREKELTQTTLMSIGDAVITTDSQGRVTSLNPVAEVLTGWLNSEASGKSINDVFPVIDAQSRESIPNPVDKVMATGEVVHLSNHTTLVSRNGAEYHITDSAAPILHKGRNVGMVLVFNDITEQYLLREALRASHNRIERLLNDMTAMIGILDRDGRLLFTNNAPLQNFALQADKLIDQVFWQVPLFSYSREVSDKVRASFEHSLQGGSRVQDLPLMTQKGLFWIEFSTRPLTDHDGNVQEVFVEGYDINERKQQEELLRRTQKMDALGKLTGGIAHDFNNLLGIILGYASLLQHKLEDRQELLKYTSHIQHAAERGSSLTKKLLAFTQQKASNPTAIDINAVLNDSQQMLQKTLTPRIKLQYDLGRDLWSVLLDANDLEDVVLNMLINSMHAIDDQGDILVTTDNLTASECAALSLSCPEGDYVRLSIRDNGCGMDSVTREHIFDPFFTTKGDHGTGLGLSQAYGFLSRSGGCITVESKPGEGSCFHLYFPRYESSSLPPASPEDKPADELDGSETILVVDDEPDILSMNAEILARHGYQVLTAHSGREALEKLETTAVQLVLSDVIMPVMDGYQLAAFIHQQYPDIQVQLVSGYSDDRHMKSRDETLYQHTLHKPYEPEDLLRAVRQLLDQPA